MRLRLIVSFALIILVTLSSLVFFARQGTAREVGAFMARGGMVTSSDLVEDLQEYYLINGSWDGIQTAVQALGSPGGRGFGGMMGHGQAGMMISQRLLVADGDGNIVADSSSSTPEGRLSPGERQRALPIPDDAGQTVGYLLVTGGEEPLLTRLNQAAGRAALIAGAISLLLALLLAYTVLRPIHHLTQAASLMAMGDLSQRVPAHGKDEISNLGRAFNHMASSLQDAEESRRALTADIAHELRTPLAIQRAQLEALQDGIYSLTVDNIQPLIDQNSRLARLVEDLRTLALAESGELHLEREPLQLAGLVERSLERFRAQADLQQIRLRFEQETGPCPPVLLDGGRVEQILDNLLSNALRHTPQEGSICLRLTCNSSHLTLSIQDSGPGIPEKALPHVFERFYRADKGRDRQDGGTGLGLAIARQLAQAHGGELTAKNAPEGGALFSLLFPINSDQG